MNHHYSVVLLPMLVLVLDGSSMVTIQKIDQETDYACHTIVFYQISITFQFKVYETNFDNTKKFDSKK